MSASGGGGLVCGAEGSTTSFWVVLDVRWVLDAPITGFMRPTPETEGRRARVRVGRALKDVGEVGGGREGAGGLDMLERGSNYERHPFGDERYIPPASCANALAVNAATGWDPVRDFGGFVIGELTV